MTAAERWLDLGRKEGLDLGRKEGLDLGRKEGLDLGRKEGQAEAVLDVLALRELPVPAQVREQVLATRDEPTLLGWLARALTVASAEELVAAEEA